MQANAYLSEDGKKVFWILRTNVHRESKKQDTKLLAITSPTIPIFKFFSLADSVVNLQQIYVQILHHALNMSLHYSQTQTSQSHILARIYSWLPGDVRGRVYQYDT